MPDEPTPQDAGQQNAGQEQPFDFDAWLGEQPEQVRKGYEGHTAKLQSALASEREQRKEVARQLKELTGKAEKGSEAEKTLGEMSSKLELAEQRAAFFEESNKPEIGCTNPKAAFLVAKAEGLFTKRGDPDWPAIKAAAPELFASRKAPPGHAGSGNGSQPPPTGGMNAYIRAAAGRT